LQSLPTTALKETIKRLGVLVQVFHLFRLPLPLGVVFCEDADDFANHAVGRRGGDDAAANGASSVP
jgi:hypothetical protein